jgi:hypothetical protein
VDNRISVTSSNVASVGWDRETSTLEVEFTSGAIYQYFDVREDVFRELISAASVGKYFNEHVKGNYRYARA